jgi:hypothetical protein
MIQWHLLRQNTVIYKTKYKSLNLGGFTSLSLKRIKLDFSRLIMIDTLPQILLLR